LILVVQKNQNKRKSDDKFGTVEIKGGFI